MCQVAFDIPDEVLYDAKMSKKDALNFARQSVALCSYAQRGISLGYCAEIAGMSKEEFVRFLGQNHKSVFRFDDKNEFLEEFNNA